MKSEKFWITKRWFAIILTALALILSVLSLFFWLKRHRVELLSTIKNEAPHCIETSRQQIPHHLFQFIDNRIKEPISAVSTAARQTILGICDGMNREIGVLYKGLLRMRVYDDTLTLACEVGGDGFSLSPMQIEHKVLIAYTGASILEGFYFSASGADYRVILPVIKDQQRLGVVEFIFTPETLLGGLNRFSSGTWQWSNDSTIQEAISDGLGLAVKAGRALFSGTECQAIFRYSSDNDWLKADGSILVLITTVILLLLLVFLSIRRRHIAELGSSEPGRKKEEQDLSILSQAVEQSNVAVMVTDTEGRIEYVNCKFLQLTGYEREDLLGKNPRILKSLATPAEVYSDLWQTLSSGKAWSGEFYNKKKSGELFWDVTFIAPVRDERGGVVHYVAVKEDITERKQMEVELIAAKDTAETANQAKSHFLANMSHEIRTPMNAIIGMTELTLKTALDDEQQGYLKSVIQAAENLLAILDEILDLSKIESGTLRLDHSPFLLREQVRYWMEGMGGKASKKGLELLLDVDDDIPELLIGDFIRLGQILANLLSNAVKFTVSGGILVRVELSGEEDAMTSELHFMVSDTGIGVAGEKKREIFEKFAQEDVSSTRRFGGAGLGLAVCSELVGLMKGRIWVDSPSEWAFGGQHGPGSTFHFTVRLGRQYEHNDPYITDLTLDGRYKRVIILLKNQMRNKTLKGWCENGGLIPRVASSFQEAWQWSMEEANTLLLIDGESWPVDFQFSGPLPKMNRIVVFIDTHNVSIPVGLEEICTLISKKPVCIKDLLEQISTPKIHCETVTADSSFQDHQSFVLNHSSILVAEDNSLNQKLIRRLLEKAGCRVTIAENGRNAVELALHNSFDLILMDIQMPEMDGVSATKKLRDEGCTLPIIALTAHALKGDREKFLEAGMDDYLGKPIRQEELYTLITEYLDKRKD